MVLSFVHLQLYGQIISSEMLTKCDCLCVALLAESLLQIGRNKFSDGLLTAIVLIVLCAFLQMIYTTMDTGNFFVISGSPREVWTAEEYKLTHSRDSLRAQFEVHPDDSVIAVVGGPFLYNWRWREHALVIRAFTRTVSMLGNASQKGGRRIQLFIIGHGNHSSSYGAALQVLW